MAGPSKLNSRKPGKLAFNRPTSEAQRKGTFVCLFSAKLSVVLEIFTAMTVQLFHTCLISYIDSPMESSDMMSKQAV